MYNFIDVTETQAGVSLPSEAMMINGEYIENLISGYRTLTVEGREALSPELTATETGFSDGSTMQGKRYPARIIRITYQLAAETNEAFREAYNKLAGILNVTDAQLIFADEQDKFFTGTPSYIGEVPPGRNIVVGDFEITCLDPFKYSVMEYEATAFPGDSSITLDYGGTYKSFPVLQAEFFNENDASEDGETATPLTGSGDCGYVAFFTEDEKIIQLGDPEETEGDDKAYQMSQTLVNSAFNKSGAWGSAAKAAWQVNAGITSSDAVEQAGNVAVSVATQKATGTINKTTTTILNAVSTAERPYIHYTVQATLLNRTENAVTFSINVKARLESQSSYFGNGYELKAYVDIGGIRKTLTIKHKDDYWRGTTWHDVSFTVQIPVDVAATKITGVKFGAYRTDNTGGDSGFLSVTDCVSIPVPAYVIPTAETWYLAPSSFGTGTDWHGPSITRTIPADGAGDVGASMFRLSFLHKMAIANTVGGANQFGAFQALAVAGSGASRKIVAGLNVYKGSAGKKAKLRFYVNNTVVKTMDVDLSYTNKYFSGNQTTTITKRGKTVEFQIGRYLHAQFTDANIANTAVTEITFTFTQFGTKPKLAYNGLYWAKFVKDNCETWKDIPNKFGANDIVEADCKTGEILLNGASMPSLGALGNDWEGFCLTPGSNQIGTSYSEWVAPEYAPSFKVRYREVFL
ncbi:MAG: phage tail family protein [Clostridia bacterium]|nr:phage tail family protein [Clostridia bacterium]MBO7151008.1 phage tail family protein [Clostridia bacterium]